MTLKPNHDQVDFVNTLLSRTVAPVVHATHAFRWALLPGWRSVEPA
jgi:hypothetical protein